MSLTLVLRNYVLLFSLVSHHVLFISIGVWQIN
uniref:Uncharacterized protein n=1 Tax=Arundo donax TaxID=35708 RepID=A0A0A9BXK8_ARUDO